MTVSGGSGAGSGSMLVAWGAENVAALLAMRDLGHLVHNVKVRGAETASEACWRSVPLDRFVGRYGFLFTHSIMPPSIPG